MQPSVMKTIMFAVGISAVCAVLVSSSAVLLRDRQDSNKLLDQQKKVLVVAGLMEQGEKLPSDEEIATRLAKVPAYKPEVPSKWLRRYAAQVTSANTGAVLADPG